MVVRQMEESIQQKDILFKECEHRLLNGLQLIASLLTIQSRAIENAEAAAQLKIAANRVAPTLGLFISIYTPWIEPKALSSSDTSRSSVMMLRNGGQRGLAKCYRH